MVYADLQDDEDKDEMVEMCTKIRDVLRANNIPVIASRDFIPHLTLFKLSNSASHACHPDVCLIIPTARKGSLRRFPDRVYFEYAQQLFGTEVCCALESSRTSHPVVQTIESIDFCELKVAKNMGTPYASFLTSASQASSPSQYYSTVFRLAMPTGRVLLEVVRCVGLMPLQWRRKMRVCINPISPVFTPPQSIRHRSRL